MCLPAVLLVLLLLAQETAESRRQTAALLLGLLRSLGMESYLVVEKVLAVAGAEVA